MADQLKSALEGLKAGLSQHFKNEDLDVLIKARIETTEDLKVASRESLTVYTLHPKLIDHILAAQTQTQGKRPREDEEEDLPYSKRGKVVTIDELEERLAKYSEDQAVKQDKSDKADICKSSTGYGDNWRQVKSKYEIRPLNAEKKETAVPRCFSKRPSFRKERELTQELLQVLKRRGGKVIEERTRADGEKYIYKLQYGGKVLIVTEKKAVLDRLMPDITTTPIEAGNTEISQTAVEFMEVQTGEELDDEHYGKCDEYSIRTLLTQFERPFVSCLLTNLIDMTIITIMRCEGGCRMLRTLPIKLSSQDGTNAFYNFFDKSLEQSGFAVPKFSVRILDNSIPLDIDATGLQLSAEPANDPQTLSLEALLAARDDRVVYRAKCGEKDLICKAHMKPALEESIQSIQRDQALLQRLHNARLEESPHVGLASLPRLQAAMEVQIAGGHQVHVTLTEPVTAPWAVHEVEAVDGFVDALEALHTLPGGGYVHADIEPRHLGCAEAKGHLFDTDSSRSLDDVHPVQMCTGTRVCAHREILSVLADPSKDKSIANFPRHDTTALVKAIVLKKEPYTHKKLLKIVAQGDYRALDQYWNNRIDRMPQGSNLRACFEAAESVNYGRMKSALRAWLS